MIEKIAYLEKLLAELQGKESILRRRVRKTVVDSEDEDELKDVTMVVEEPDGLDCLDGNLQDFPKDC